MTSLFDYAYKELSNSAVWMWVLSFLEDSSNQEMQLIAEDLLKAINIPKPEKIIRLSSEECISSANRIDIYLEFKIGDRRHLLLIENKIRRDSGAVIQLRRYINEASKGFDQIHGCIFSFDQGLDNKRDLVEKEYGISLFLIRDMVDFWSKYDPLPNDILQHYKQFLEQKLEKVNLARNSIQNRAAQGSATYEEWMEVAQQNGVDDLFQSFIAISEKTNPANIQYNKLRSVVAHYRTADGKGKPPPLFSLHLKNSLSEKGLWIGYSETNALKVGAHITKGHLPISFEDKIEKQGNNIWHFGYFDDEQSIEDLYSSVSLINSGLRESL